MKRTRGDTDMWGGTLKCTRGGADRICGEERWNAGEGGGGRGNYSANDYFHTTEMRSL